MLALLIVILLCFFGAAYYRKLYRKQKTAHELHGEVVSFAEFTGWRGQSGWKWYELTVEAEGKTYKIRTDNTKAKRYRKQKDIVILVPETELAFAVLTEYPQWQQLAAADPEGAAEVEAAAKRLDAKIASPDAPGYPTDVIIREDKKKAWHIWFLFIAGVCFTLLLILAILGELLVS